MASDGGNTFVPLQLQEHWHQLTTEIIYHVRVQPYSKWHQTVWTLFFPTADAGEGQADQGHPGQHRHQLTTEINYDI